jgi:hypothetical protein
MTRDTLGQAYQTLTVMRATHLVQNMKKLKGGRKF